MIFGSALILWAMTGCTPGGEFEPRLCPTRLLRVAAVQVERAGIARWPETYGEPRCAGFRPTPADIRWFLAHAGSADPYEVHMTLPESPCVARGRVRFAGGGGGRWQVDPAGNGVLDRPGRPRITLYCRRCRSRPWIQ